MLAHQRRQKIFDLLKEDGSAKVIRLAKIFKVTEVTIRQDLEKLEQEGLASLGALSLIDYLITDPGMNGFLPGQARDKQIRFYGYLCCFI